MSPVKRMKGAGFLLAVSGAFAAVGGAVLIQMPGQADRERGELVLGLALVLFAAGVLAFVIGRARE